MDVRFWTSLAAFALVLAWLARRQARGASTSSGVLLALLLAVALGTLSQAVHGHDHPSVQGALSWIGVVSGGYVRLLQMIVMPLVLFSILSAVTRLGNAGSVGRISASVLGLLMLTTAISAVIGVVVTQAFGLSAEGIVQGAREVQRGAAMEARTAEITGQTVPQLLLSFIPSNVFADLTGSRQTSVIGVVVFATLLGMAALSLQRQNPEVGQRVAGAIETLQKLVMQLVRLVLRLTPYGVLALMTRVAATSNGAEIVNLMGFVVASYVGLALILAVHAGLLAAGGVNPVRFFRETWPVLTFAFTSRSSAATIPLNVETQVNRLGVAPGVATFAASFGATIGQNGCAGLYPAMLAVMIAPGVGVDPLTPSFLGMLVLVTTLGSVGIAGFGGGATVAAILVLSSLGLPVALAGLLISVEPLIDMGRTAVNVSGAMTAGAVTQRLLGRAGEGASEGEVPASAGAGAREPLLVGS